MRHTDGGLRELSGGWLGQFFEAMRTDIRRSAARAYLEGLLDPDPRKSLRAIAERTDGIAYHQLHHFLTSAAVEDGPVWSTIGSYSNEYFGRWSGCLVIEEIVILKRGSRSYYVAPQNNVINNKVTNCQIIVSLAMVRGGYVTPIAMFPVQPAASKKYQLLARVDAVSEAVNDLIAQGVNVDYIVADGSYFDVSNFRKCLKLHKLGWIARISSLDQVGVIRDAATGINGSEITLDEIVTGSTLLDRKAELDAPPLYNSFVVDKPCFSTNKMMSLECPKNKKWIINRSEKIQIIVDMDNAGRECAFISNMHAGLHVRTISEDIMNYRKSRRAHMEMANMLGLAKFEGRSKIGLERHLLLVAIAYIYKRHIELDDIWRKSGTPLPF